MKIHVLGPATSPHDEMPMIIPRYRGRLSMGAHAIRIVSIPVDKPATPIPDYAYSQS